VEPEQIIAGLLRLPLRSIEEARVSAPATSGFYAWWCERGAVPGGASAPPHPSEPCSLLYVGIAPNTAASGSNLRKRLRQHTGANIGSSTFRLGLAALLYESEGWSPVWTDRPVLTIEDRAALGAWQLEHLRVQWYEVEEPWMREAEVIERMRPPMNREHNERHPFYTSMGVARNNLRRAARA
jgi:GIY-YIG catalytic domain-containing protein